MTRENTPNTGEVRITRRDFQEIPLKSRVKKPARQLILGFLKHRGAPIKGHFTLQYDPAYSFTEWHDPQTGDYIVRWRKVS